MLVESSEIHGPKIPEVPSPKRVEVLFIRFLVTAGLLSMLYFVCWFFTPAHVGHPALFALVSFSIGFKFLRTLHEWIHYTGVSVPNKPKGNLRFTVDMLTTHVPGEPYEMVETTLRAMKAVSYPHTTYLCDEGNDPYLIKLCRQLEVKHIYRGEDKTDAKAGNINYALKEASGDIVVILDPDHIPRPEFLDEILPFFLEEKVGFVQTVQGYYNQRESIIAKGAAEQTYSFYGPMMMSMNRYGTVQAIGANCAFRRAALDSIGGHAPGLAEDMHTAMQLHACGWKSVYVPKILTRGKVPASLSTYYQQQLKWTRGTLELLFRVLPKLIRKFSWRQILHYGSLPLYFLYGLIALIDISIPVISLVSWEVPWLGELDQLFLHTIPLLLMVLIIRQYSQKWALESSERGLHFLGGSLLLSAWWIYLLGFIYTLLKIQVPYIPTPKEDQLRNDWVASIPNLVVIAILFASVGIGLTTDWNPYSLIMAWFALINAVLLGLITSFAQRKAIRKLYSKVNPGRKVRHTEAAFVRFRHTFIYAPLRSIPVALTLVFFVGIGSLSFSGLLSENPVQLQHMAQKPSEGLYLGSVFRKEVPLSPQANVSVFQLSEDPLRWEDALEAMQLVARSGKIPFLVWEPWKGISEGTHPLHSYQSVSSSSIDSAFISLIEKLHKENIPIFMSFAPSPDLPRQEWEEFPGNSSDEYLAAIDHLHSLALTQGFYNLCWIEEIFGTDRMVDFIKPLSHQLFSCSGQSIPGLPSLENRFLTYRALFQHSPLWITSLSLRESEPESIQSFFAQVPLLQGIVFEGEIVPKFIQNKWGEVAPVLSHELTFSSCTPQSGQIARSSSGSFHFIPEGEELYIKGIAYNPSHDWRDGFYPLTRKILQKDFETIRHLGANTIRRYSPGIYDRNILNAAADAGLFLLYGFWFDPSIDYLTDIDQVNKYRREVLSKVRELKDESSILAWGIGNETWGLLKHHFSETYLPQVRMAYLHMIDSIIQEIRAMDPQRAVFCSLEHSENLSFSLEAYADLVTGIDFIGVNSYYNSRTSKLDSIFTYHYPELPYFVSEFGPEGYWEENLGSWTPQGFVMEQSSYEKAGSYFKIWTDYIRPNRGNNLGGVAFSWKDRMEGSISWFGLTDYLGAIKPGMYAIAQAWKNDNNFSFPLPDVFISPIDFPQKVLRFRGVMPGRESYPSVNISWLLREEGILDPVNIREVSDDGLQASLSVDKLKRGKPYRVYFRVHDEKTNSAVWASYPFSLP